MPSQRDVLTHHLIELARGYTAREINSALPEHLRRSHKAITHRLRELASEHKVYVYQPQSHLPPRFFNKKAAPPGLSDEGSKQSYMMQVSNCIPDSVILHILSSAGPGPLTAEEIRALLPHRYAHHNIKYLNRTMRGCMERRLVLGWHPDGQAHKPMCFRINNQMDEDHDMTTDISHVVPGPRPPSETDIYGGDSISDLYSHRSDAYSDTTMHLDDTMQPGHFTDSIFTLDTDSSQSLPAATKPESVREPELESITHMLKTGKPSVHRHSHHSTYDAAEKLLPYLHEHGQNLSHEQRSVIKTFSSPSAPTIQHFVVIDLDNSAAHINKYMQIQRLYPKTWEIVGVCGMSYGGPQTPVVLRCSKSARDEADCWAAFYLFSRAGRGELHDKVVHLVSTDAIFASFKLVLEQLPMDLRAKEIYHVANL